ncbi:MAG: hypothetical protein ABI273_06600, partial [Lacunisphaera sp.]
TLLQNWMAWDGGVDLVAATQPGLSMPNIIVHVARLVHTPVGSAPSGIVFYQPDPAAPPAVIGFVSTDPKVGTYFGPKIFAGTPFEQAPVLTAKIEISSGDDFVGATITVGSHVFRTRLSGLGKPELVQRAPGGMTPFIQQGIEAIAAKAQLWVNDVEVAILVPPVGISGGPAAVSAPVGLYAR